MLRAKHRGGRVRDRDPVRPEAFQSASRQRRHKTINIRLFVPMLVQISALYLRKETILPTIVKRHCNRYPDIIITD